MDVCEIGSKIHERGSVIRVKILGTVALIDEGKDSECHLRNVCSARIGSLVQVKKLQTSEETFHFQNFK